MTREKVFNGLSGLPKIIMWGVGIIISLLIVVVGLVGSARAKTADVERRVLDHIEWGYRQQAENEETDARLKRLLEELEHDVEEVIE